MIPTEYTELLQKLFKKTKEKLAVWNKSSGEEQFVLKLTDGTIIIEADFDLNEGTVFRFSILNNDGVRIEFFEVKDDFNNRDDFLLMSELHATIKRIYYKVEETIKNITNEIDNSYIVGSDENSEKIEKEDLPF